jgi:hypothetical protein
MPAIDFSEVKGLEPIPNGQYEATIVHAEVGTSKKGFPKIDLRWQVDLADGSKRNVFDSMSFHPDALWRTKLTLQGLGFPDSYSGEIGPEDLVGRSALITVGLDTGRTDPATNEPYPDRNRVIKVKPIGSDMGVDDFVS